MSEPYDVIVVGGGTAGVVAAVQAARAEARTLLIEKNGLLGGTVTAGGVSAPGRFHGRGRQLVAGIGWELVTRCLDEAGDELPDCTTDASSMGPHIRLNAPLYAALCDEMCVEAGVELWLHVMCAGVRHDAEAGLWRLEACTKTGPAEVATRTLIDCTGDANVVTLAGLEVIRPEQVQPGTLTCRLSGYDPASLDYDALDAAFAAEVAAGRLVHGDGGWNAERPGVRKLLEGRGHNANHIIGVNAADSTGRTAMELAGRRSLLRVYRWLRTQPGLENLRIDWIAPECGVRETVVIAGAKTITERDYVTGRVWDDSLCYAMYPVDLHIAAGRGIHAYPPEEGKVPTVPRGALLPAGSRNLLVAGRCVSSDRLANSGLRVEASCMAMGQAAGAIAALAAQRGADVGDVEIDAVRALLTAHGAVVP
ncbi:MAG: FAD-dependent oxidoreductase [Planctomycetota bacterium]